MDHASRSAVLALLALAIAVVAPGGSARAAADPDSAWFGAFALPGFDGPVTALVIYHGDLIAAGGFTHAGATRANRIARFDGVRWQPLGNGFDDEVYALAIWHDHLIAGGAFANSGGTPAGRVASWDGASWSAMDFSREGLVDALHVLRDTLYAGGWSYDRVSGSSDPVLWWDGAAWQGEAAGLDGQVYALSDFADRLVVGGDIRDPATGATLGVAEWRYGAWYAVGGGLHTALDPTQDYAPVLALAQHQGALYAGGLFSLAGSTSVQNLARWDGTSWSDPGATSGTVVALYSSGDSLFVGGGFTGAGGVSAECVALLRGNTWNALGEGLDFGVSALIVYRGLVVAGGSFTHSGAIPILYLGIWDPQAGMDTFAWRSSIGADPTTNGLTSLLAPAWVGALTAFDDGMVAAGSFDLAASPSGWIGLGSIARWDGLTWSPLGSQTFYGAIDAFAMYHGDLVAAGSFTIGGVSAQHQNVARWDGLQWSVIGGGIDGEVRALTVFGDELVAGGPFELAGSLLAFGVARWDGTSWRPFGAPVLDTTALDVRGLAAWNGDLIVAGGFTTMGGTATRGLARWDGAGWSEFAGGADAPVWALSSYGPDLVIGGDFTRVGGSAIPGIARWDGSAWHPLGNGFPAGGPRALLEANGRLYAAGAFAAAGGVSANRVASWDGAVWSALGSGVGPVDPPIALAALRGHVYLGGRFTAAGGKASSLIARWDGDAPAAPGPLVRSWTSAAPNPLETSTRFSYELAQPAAVRLEIYDLTGHLVARWLNPSVGAGRHEVEWDAARQHARSGIYFVRFQAGGEERKAKIALVR